MDLTGVGARGPTKVVTTPGVKCGAPEDETEEELLSLEEARAFRSAVGSAIYLAQDRVDVLFATKELARRLHAPRKKDQRALVRLAKYLYGAKG